MNGTARIQTPLTDFEVAPVIVGEAVDLIRDVPSAEEIVRRTVACAAGLLAAREGFRLVGQDG
jgi:hypothetical protein